MRINIIIAALALSACGKTVETRVDVPVPVATPVAVPCKYTVRSINRPKDSALDLITADTPMDKDVDYWQAHVLQLLAYIAGLEAAVADRDAALRVCSDAP